jgi:LuxR family transcriptional regulator, maltose regulon positive regulatory protein
LRAPEPAGTPVVKGLIEPLTAREPEILRSSPTGCAIRRSPTDWSSGLPTVKRHVANIYGKLGVSHRTDAVARLAS